jgi:hypothetical protein
MSLSVSFPAHANDTVSGFVPLAGIVDKPLQVGTAFGTGVAVGIRVGVADGVAVGVTPWAFALIVPHINIGKAVIKSIATSLLNDNFIDTLYFSVWRIL